MSKLLITNYICLSLDKVNEVISMIRTEDGFDYNTLEQIVNIKLELLSKEKGDV